MRNMRDAYIILCHRAPWQINALAAYLAGAGHDVYIHADPASGLADAIVTNDRVKLVPGAIRIEWADWSMVQATLLSIQAMPENGRGYRYVHLISGQCLPAKPISELDAALDIAYAAGRQFMECFPLPFLERWKTDGGLHRVGVWYPRWIVSKYSPWHKWFWWYTNKWRRLRIRRPLYYLFKPFYGGAQWWSLTGACVASMAEYAAAHPRFCRFFRHSFCSDEIFFQTCFARVWQHSQAENDNKRFLKWPFQAAPSPMDLQPEHWQEIRESGAFFSRKFSLNPGETEQYLHYLEKSL